MNKIPIKLQITNYNQQVSYCLLVIVICLSFGICDLEFPIPL